MTSTQAYVKQCKGRLSPMPNVYLKRKVLLDEIAEGWDERCYLMFTAFTIDDLKDFDKATSDKTPKGVNKGADQVVAMLMKKFIEGKGMDEKNDVVALVKEDLNDIIPAAYGRIISVLADKGLKASPNSET